MRISNLSRWKQGYVRRRNERRLQHFRSPFNQLKFPCQIFLWLHAAFFVLLVASCTYGTEAHAQSIPREAQRHQRALKREAQLVWGLKAPVATFAAQIHQESRWRENALSPVGAIGLAQFMPGTATWISGLYPELRDRAPTNPTWALRALVTYDKWLADRIKADDECQDMAFALSAYNGGLGWVYKRQKLSSQPGVCLGQTCTINPGVSPASQRENQHYPEVILRKYEPLYASWGPGVCQ